MARIVFARPPAKGPLVIPNAAMVQLLWTMNGRRLRNVLFAQVTAAGPLNPNVAETIFSAIKAAPGTATWLSAITTQCSLDGVFVKDVRAPNFPNISSTTLGVSGSSTSPAISQGSAMAITLRTAFSGRGFVGRVFLPGLTVGMLQNAVQFVDLSQSQGVAFITAVATAVQNALGPLGVGQRQLLASTNPAAPPPFNAGRNAILITPVTVTSVGLRVDSQRRRLGRG